MKVSSTEAQDKAKRIGFTKLTDEDEKQNNNKHKLLWQLYGL